MKLFVEVHPGDYRDSIQLLFASGAMSEMEGVQKASIAMGTGASKTMFRLMGMNDPAIEQAGPSDLVIAVIAADEEVFRKAVAKGFAEMDSIAPADDGKPVYATIQEAVAARPDARVCVLSIPGEFVKAEAVHALNQGLHVVIFSSHVSPEDELEIKLKAKEKGLLCMGPDCGVVNLNGTAFLLGSITRRGPFGLCGATGVGIQHVGALLQAAGSGVSQILGTGGGDLKLPVGGITMLMGIDALEADPETQSILLVSRKPADEVLQSILSRISQCRKPVVACLMGCERAMVESSGAVYAENLDDVAVQALRLIGKTLPLQSDEELRALAAEAAQGMSPKQKYVRGLFTGGTYCDEAMRALAPLIGDVHSNCPLKPELLLKDSLHSEFHTCLDCGEDEFTLGKPHPTMEPSIRKPFVLAEGRDEETAVLLLDFIFAVAGAVDPVGAVIDEIRDAMRTARQRGGRLAVVASVCGTDADFQNLDEQKRKLRDAGVYVCDTNYRAALLAGEIIRRRNGGENA